MPIVPIITTSLGASREYTMGVKVEGKPVVSMVSTPVTVKGNPGVWSINETERPGKQSITTPQAPGLRGLTFSHTINSLNPYESCEHLLHPFRGIAETGKRVQFFNAGWLVEGTWWWIKALDIEELMKARDNKTSRAQLTWTVTEANRVDAVKLTKTGLKTGTVKKAGTVTYLKPGDPGWRSVND